MRCSYCGGRLNPHKDDLKFLGTLKHIHCSVDCFLGHVTSLPRDDDLLKSLKDRGELMWVNLIKTDKPVFSNLLQTSFRSQYELTFAEYMIYYTKVQVLYEPASIKVDINGTEHLYVMDFFFPEHTCFIEIKGEWRGNHGKEKVRQAMELFGEDRFLLLPPSYSRWFRK